MKKAPLLLCASALLCASHSSAQQLSYMLPDAAAPGMALYTEILGPNTIGNFGNDGINNINVEFVNPSDAQRVIVGPRVTSWSGRVVSVFLIIPEKASAGAIPYRLTNGSATSNVDTFFIVNPQHISPTLAAGPLGSGGSYGTRTRRNTMVVESLNLPTGSFTVSDVDPDPYTPGNQAYLPFTIVSKGNVSIGGTLSVDGIGINAIAGGGGGGARDKFSGGNGYTAGGGIHNTGGLGSGSDFSSFNGGASLCGTPGGVGLGLRYFDDQGAGGGTGFPFGTGGMPGTWYQEGGDNPPGGIGGGSGGGEKSMPDSSFGGGGGGFARDGMSSGLPGTNGGHAYGNPLIVPFCGGSGGGGGNQYGDGQAGSGGAGGGAIHIISLGKIDVHGSITANGADGESTQGIMKGGGGGAGSGGAIALTAPFLDIDGRLSVRGGRGGEAVLSYERGGLFGGDGSEGRIRLVGFVERSPEPVPSYIGPSNVKLSTEAGVSTLSGTGTPGDSILVFTSTAGDWSYGQPLTTHVGDDGRWTTLCPSTITSAGYVSVLEQLHASDQSSATQAPLWVMSPASVVSISQAAAAVQPTPAGSGLSISLRSSASMTNVISISGGSLEQVHVNIVDLLGRSHISTDFSLDGFGSKEWVLPTNSLNTGVFIVIVTSSNGTASRTISIAK